MPSACRFCGSPLTHTVVDLGLSPISNAFRPFDIVDREPQTFYPLKVMVCDACWLAQIVDVETPAHFNPNYVYFSSYSQSWLEHAEAYAGEMTRDLALGAHSKVVEVASNDGYLLQYFKARGIPVLGIEPSGNVAEHARTVHGIETIDAFFGKECAAALVERGVQADLIAANNVLAHVPDINDFVGGFTLLLKPGGTLTIEFPHLLNMLRECQFDTIYHEHYSYLSLGAVERTLTAHGLAVHGARRLPTHGGSLRLYAGHAGQGRTDPALARTLEEIRRDELDDGLETLAPYTAFSAAVERRKVDFVSFLIAAKTEGKTVVGYGAPAKGNTMLNYCGVGPELLAYTVDRSPHKQRHFLPGLNIPVHAPERIFEDRPDYIVILPWNLKEEISQQLQDARAWGARFVVVNPELSIF